MYENLKCFKACFSQHKLEMTNFCVKGDYRYIITAFLIFLLLFLTFVFSLFFLHKILVNF